MAFGTSEDYEFCSAVDRILSQEVLDWKLAKEEIVIAYQDKMAVGYLRLEYLWSKVPYIGLIWVRDVLPAL